MNSTFYGVTGPVLSKRADLSKMLLGLEEKDVLFIDEIHRMAKPVSELLFPVMEDFKMDLQLGGRDTGGAQTLQMQVPRFTLVGATTRSGALLRPLRQRFELTVELQFYTVEELTQIVIRSAGVLEEKLGEWTGLPESPERMIARRARGTARIANKLLKLVRDYRQASGDHEIWCRTVRNCMQLHGIDEDGLTGLDRRLLRAIIEGYGGGPVGLGALANTLMVEVHELAEVSEPYLLHSGYIVLTSRGRQITDKGREVFENGRRETA
jgi:Holliday junction DNA helicase RuvB